MNKLINQAIVVSGLLAWGGLASAANKVDYVDLAKTDGIHITDGKIFINPVNGNYGQASSSTMTYHLKAKAGCNGYNRVKTFFIALGAENVSKVAMEPSGNYRQDVPKEFGKKTVPWTEVEMKVPMGKLGFNPAAMCQANLEQKMQQGASKQQVLSQDQVLSKGVWFTTVASCGKTGGSTVHYGSKFIGAELKIICKSGSGGGINNIQVQQPKPTPGGINVQSKFHVTNMTFKATPYKLSTTCPATAKFTGTISASGPGTVKYRVLFPGSAKSSIRGLQFDKAGTRSIGIAEFETDHSLPTASATLEIISPVSMKKHTNFKVQCITQGAGGVGNIQQQPSQNQAPQMKLNQPKQPTPKLLIQQQDDEEEPARREEPRR